jgi:hypothetical protein
MPHHCRNTLVISAATLPEITRRYVRKNEKGERIFDFERIVPEGF